MISYKKHALFQKAPKGSRPCPKLSTSSFGGGDSPGHTHLPLSSQFYFSSCETTWSNKRHNHDKYIIKIILLFHLQIWRKLTLPMPWLWISTNPGVRKWQVNLSLPQSPVHLSIAAIKPFSTKTSKGPSSHRPWGKTTICVQMINCSAILNGVREGQPRAQ